MKALIVIVVAIVLLFIAETVAKEMRGVLFPFLGVIGLVVFVLAVIYEASNKSK